MEAAATIADALRNEKTKKPRSMGGADYSNVRELARCGGF
jgi:hypothetical protein